MSENLPCCNVFISLGLRFFSCDLVDKLHKWGDQKRKKYPVVNSKSLNNN